eukprot:TRINITY_DN11304_c0_g1_i1.p1 TRINITY_DN11304_c0_g1~~TRINITY_DN11304_c0_g1_i1.p1  ORF type:complete len:669 (+),score=98.85 TRINITY_DN11304_c0_g1_i1:138-2144(+)
MGGDGHKEPETLVVPDASANGLKSPSNGAYQDKKPSSLVVPDDLGMEKQVSGQTCNTRRCSEDFVEADLEDPADVVAPRRARTAIFFMLCQVVQMFMSYDGGATPASLDTIQEEMNGAWTTAEFGLLGSMDKIGMTATSMIWGRALQLCNAKLLLAIGLLLNAACTLAFGALRDKGMMYSAKLFMGATQALQGVWGTVWTVTMAPPQSKTMWLGLGAVSAGLGNGIGTGVAGFGTANGMPYAFAFQLQAVVLALLWVYLVLQPARWLRMELPNRDRSASSTSGAGETPESPASAAPKEAPGIFQQLKSAYDNKVYGWTTLAISLAMFECSGIQFLWVRVFVEVWGLDKNWVTLAFLLVTGVGGGIGVAFGPSYIDKQGGFNTPPGVVHSLRCLFRFQLLAASAGMWGVACLYGKLRALDSGIWREWGDHWLWILWTCVMIIWGAHNACVPALCGINCEVVPDAMRPFAAGIEMTFRNILGYAFGPLLPGILMDWMEKFYGWDVLNNRSEANWQLGFGFGIMMFMNILGVLILHRAIAASSNALTNHQAEALKALREAFALQDVKALKKAVKFARRVELQNTPDGESVLGMANQAIGASKTESYDIFRSSASLQVLSATSDELLQRLRELELEVLGLKKENEKLRLLAVTDAHGQGAYEPPPDTAVVQI